MPDRHIPRRYDSDSDGNSGTTSENWRSLCRYAVSVKAGILMSAFVLLYMGIVIVLYVQNRSQIYGDLVSFATQYGQVQRKLLKELAIPYALLDEDGKGCSPTDTGMLDLSHLSASSTRKFRFAQGEPTLPSGYIAPVQAEAPAQTEPQPEEASDPESDTEGADAAPADEPTAAAAEQQ